MTIIVPAQQQHGIRQDRPFRKFIPETYMPEQNQSWTCSLHALSWLMRALGHYDYAWQNAMMEVGYPLNVNPNYGLMDGSGQVLADVLINHGYNAKVHQNLSYDEIHDLAEQGLPMITGGGTINSMGSPIGFYHWVGVRGVLDDGPLWIATSAPGWTGYGNKVPIYNALPRELYDILGPWSAVVIHPDGE